MFFFVTQIRPGRGKSAPQTFVGAKRIGDAKAVESAKLDGSLQADLRAAGVVIQGGYPSPGAGEQLSSLD